MSQSDFSSTPALCLLWLCGRSRVPADVTLSEGGTGTCVGVRIAGGFRLRTGEREADFNDSRGSHETSVLALLLASHRPEPGELIGELLLLTAPYRGLASAAAKAAATDGSCCRLRAGCTDGSCSSRVQRTSSPSLSTCPGAGCTSASANEPQRRLFGCSGGIFGIGGSL